MVYRWGAEQRAADLLSTQVLLVLARARFVEEYGAALHLVNYTVDRLLFD